MSAKPTVLLNTVLEFLKTKYPNAKNLKPHQEGMESQVFSFNDDVRKYILRLNRDEEGFRKDALCEKLFAHHLSIPKIIAHGRFDQNLFFCISNFADGTTLQDCNPAQLQPLIPMVQELQEKISQLPIAGLNGFGPFNSSGEAEYASWKSYLHSLTNAQNWPQLKSKLEPAQTEILNGAIRHYESLIRTCPETRAVYHGDFGSNNVLVKDNKITALIDWDCAGTGDPLIDIAGAYYWASHLECMRLQAEYADSTLAALPNYRQRIDCYQLKTGIAEIKEGLEENEPLETLDWHFNALAEISKQVA